MLIEKNFDLLILLLGLITFLIASIVVYKRKHFINWYIVILSGTFGNFIFYVRNLLLYGREIADSVYLFSVIILFIICSFDYQKYITKTPIKTSTFLKICCIILILLIPSAIFSYLINKDQINFLLLLILLYMAILLFMSTTLYLVILLKSFTIMKLFFYLAILSVFISNLLTITSFSGLQIFWDASYLFQIISIVFFISCSLSVIFEDKFMEITEMLNLSELDLQKQINVNKIVNQLDHGFIVLDSQGTILLMNSKIKNYCSNYNNSEVGIGSVIFNLRRTKLIETFKLCLSKFSDLSFDTELDSGSVFKVVCTKIAISDNDNQLSNALIIELYDISKFVEFNKLRTSFVSMVSHELRSPISSISMAIRNLIQYSDKLKIDEKEKLTNIILKNSDLMVEIIEDLLVVSQIDEKGVKLNIKKINIIASLKDVIFQQEEKSKIKNIKIDLFFNSEIVIQADEVRIEQIFRIILDNAIKYSYNNGIIKIIIENSQKNGQKYVKISIQDFGRGMKKTDLDNLFQRFYRSPDVNKIKGTGLGLAIAKELIDLHNGLIEVSSHFGDGSIFSIYIPLK